MSSAALVRTTTPAQRRNDVWLALALLISAVISAWLGTVAGFYGENTPAFGWALVYVAALTLPLALRRRFPEALIVVALAFFVGVSVHPGDLRRQRGPVHRHVHRRGVGERPPARNRRAARGDRGHVHLASRRDLPERDRSGRRRPSRAGLFSPFAAYMIIQFLVNAAYFGGAYFFGERAWADARARAVLEERTAELEREREITAAGRRPGSRPYRP
jgi:hypothetical protein